MPGSLTELHLDIAPAEDAGALAQLHAEFREAQLLLSFRQSPPPPRWLRIRQLLGRLLTRP